MIRVMSVLVSLVLLMSGCAASVKEPVVSGFRCRADMTYGDSVYVGTLDRTTEQEATLTLSEPPGLNGVVMRLCNGQVTVGYAGMQMTVSENEMPVGALIGVLCDALDACVNGTVEGNTVEGTCACGPYCLTLDHASGLPVSLVVPSLALQVDFSCWELPQGAA